MKKSAIIIAQIVKKLIIKYVVKGWTKESLLHNCEYYNLVKKVRNIVCKAFCVYN